MWTFVALHGAFALTGFICYGNLSLLNFFNCDLVMQSHSLVQTVFVFVFLIYPLE
ncbi:hypothetical protein PHJA_000678800 [Phtheirospermum japonicum]|uniref:Uncharacterized protein n=1 Tax=Phtheirospermum japonicum TaxID=374723 RepID=A0A830BTC6_9LAMI|nr:hypothetical protein PHJA_000678800 [Phtheirospermum japonicum]